MGFYAVKRHRLKFPEFGEDDGQCAQVVVRSMSVAEAMAFNEVRNSPRPDTAAGASERTRQLAACLARVLVEWNLTDADGVPLPTTTDGVLAADETLIALVVRGWTAKVVDAPPITPELGKDSTSGQPFPEESIPMETRSPSLAS